MGRSKRTSQDLANYFIVAAIGIPLVTTAMGSYRIAKFTRSMGGSISVPTIGGAAIAVTLMSFIDGRLSNENMLNAAAIGGIIGAGMHIIAI